ncbi:MAG: translation initiation factor IF-2 N-terminal domain-containing protein, partial [Oscillospiraceae bacterium]|nr:translation initiation factor IF-2 N-terminal domain-containing protein [Oscillospiraceae bacterium]
MENKNKVSNLAKDFGLQSKDILAILKQYTEGAKGHSQVLDDREVSIVFDALTLKNQVKIEAIFAESYQEKKEEKAAAPAAKPENKPAAAPAPKQEGNKPAAAAPQPSQQQPSKSTATQQPTTRVPEKKIVDTRKSTNVNLDKYDEKLQDMAERSSSGRRDNMSAGKEKFRNQKGGKNPNLSNKRKQEEAEKMRRLQLEVIKKTPLKVQIPEEISVGELASRMKKTGAEVVKCLMKNGVMASLSQMI